MDAGRKRSGRPRLAATMVVALLVAASGEAPSAPTAGVEGSQASRAAGAGPRQAAAAALFDRIRSQPARLRVFLQAMPKGGDLHNHLWGTPYAEEFLAWAADDGLCVSTATRAIVACGGQAAVPADGLATRDPALYSAMIDSLSLRAHNSRVGSHQVSGHDQFFATFDRFAPVAVRSAARMIASAREKAAADNVSYVELMHAPAATVQASELAAGIALARETDIAAAWERLAPALRRLVAAARAETDGVEREAAELLGCPTAPGKPACRVTVRYQAFALRLQPAPVVFAQLALAFALADADPRFVGVNIVQPEDGYTARRDYALHMAMFRFLRERYPRVKKALHAGELALGLVPAADLRHHIRQAVEVAGADRIGHGVAISYETDAPALLADMARARVPVEINLTSHDVILGVRGRDHPLALYRAANVPVVLSTDDLGVSRSDMTQEYMRAAIEQELDYGALKQLARASLEHAFLPGDSLWADGVVGTPVAPCRGSGLGGAVLDRRCGALVGASEKAQAQWRLEGELARFEAEITRLPF